MNPEILLCHLDELGITISLFGDPLTLDLQAPKGTLTPEVIELVREHKPELVQLVFEREERAAIQWEGCHSLMGRSSRHFKFVGDLKLLGLVWGNPEVIKLMSAFADYGGEIEVMKAEPA